ncbi:hypothetical protein ACROYT_G008832 [Oculina patagonica]
MSTKDRRMGLLFLQKCGGWCGKCRPIGEMLVEQTVCRKHEDSPKETTLSTAVTVSTGSDITITCKAHGVPLPRYNFFFNNKTINDTEAERSGVLTLTAVSFDQSGVYSCTPEYAKGRGVKKEVTVYIRQNKKCGIRPPHSKIIGGRNTRPGAWPWQVSLKHRHRGHQCGGSVVGPQWILTAAHCFDGLNQTNFTIITGEHHLSRADGLEQEVAIEKLIKHPRYDESCNYNNDVAMLKLTKPLRYNNRVGPVCLPKSDFSSGTNCYITGWGTTENSTQAESQVLKEAKLPLVSRDTCQKSYNDLRSFGFCITEHMRCAGYARGGVDACRGDSGGPLVCQRNRKWHVMGVVSWGAGCGQSGRYGVYADVLKLKKWIKQTIKDS